MVHLNKAFAGLLVLASTVYAAGNNCPEGLWQCKYADGGHCCVMGLVTAQKIVLEVPNGLLSALLVERHLSGT
ncbi:hypothetical protein AC578_6764, partial [Pseudocercospora eumusae]